MLKRVLRGYLEVSYVCLCLKDAEEDLEYMLFTINTVKPSVTLDEFNLTKTSL